MLHIKKKREEKRHSFTIEKKLRGNNFQTLIDDRIYIAMRLPGRGSLNKA